MNKKIIFSICLVLAMIAGNTMAQTTATTQIPVKIGYCNPEYILTNLPEAKTIENELGVYEKQLQAQLDTKIADFKRKYEDFQRIVQDPAVPPSVKEDKEKELLQMEQSIKDYEEKAQQDLQYKQMQLLQPLLEKIQKSIDKVAESNGYTYILNVYSDNSGSAIILYARYKTDDISLLVLKDMGVVPPATPATGGTTGGTAAPAPTHSGTAPRPMAPTK